MTLADGVTYEEANKWLDKEEWSQKHISDYELLEWQDDEYEACPIKVSVYDIERDCDGDDPKTLNLPETTAFEIPYEDRDNLEEVISDKLSDNFGFCHKGFKYELMEE